MIDYSSKIALFYWPDEDIVTGSYPYSKIVSIPEDPFRVMMGEVRIDLVRSSIHPEDLIGVMKNDISKLSAIAKWADAYISEFTFWEKIL